MRHNPSQQRALAGRQGCASEILRLLEQDGWVLKRVTGSHRHYTHPGKPGLVTVAGKPCATLKPKTEASILKQAGLRRERR